MPRPVQIDRAKALRAARRIFWRQGYSATSMSQLLDNMGIGSGSFYAAFESKFRLFESVIDDYTRWSLEQFEAVRAEHAGLEAIRSFLGKTLVDVSDSDRHKGCLLVNSVLEFDDVEPELHRRASDALNRLKTPLKLCIDEAIVARNLRPDISASDAVDLLMNQIQGLRVESRLGLSRHKARRRISTLIAILSTTDREESQLAGHA